MSIGGGNRGKRYFEYRSGAEYMTDIDKVATMQL
jgi:hypothetical protein